MTSVQDYWPLRKHLLEILHMPCIEGNNGLPQYHHHGTGKTRGKPCIRGMRITVYDILSYLAAEMTPEEVLDDFPYLTKEEIWRA